MNVKLIVDLDGTAGLGTSFGRIFRRSNQERPYKLQYSQTNTYYNFRRRSTIIRKVDNYIEDAYEKNKIINIIIYIIIFSIGCCCGKLIDWGYFVLNKEISIIDAISLFLTIGCAIYISKVLEKEVQDVRIEKEMFISRRKHRISTSRTWK